MGQIASFFKRRENDDFETILNELEDSIRTKEENLAFIRQRERRAIVLFTSYSILIWLLYVLAWWFGALDWGSKGIVNDGGEEHDDEWLKGGSDEIVARIAKTLPVGAIPVLIFFTRRIVKSWYARKQNAENKQLTNLRKKQKDQIDKLKKLSNYDKITEMLERHGQVPPRSAMPGTPARQSESKGNSIPGSAYSTPVGGMFGPGGGRGLEHLTPAQRSALMKSQQKGQQNPLLNTGMLASNQKQNVMGKQAPLNRKLFPAPPGPVPPLPSMPNVPNPPPMGMTFDGNMDINSMTPPHQPKTFIDKIADALLGGDEQSPASKYALICQKCFAHNGLVLKDEVMDVQFVCPRCGHFNPSRRARMTGSSGLSRPSSGQGHREERTSKDMDESLGGDESMALSSPTTHVHPGHKKSASASVKETTEQELDQDGNDVSMDEGILDEEEENQLTSKMNADERREKLRRRTSRKNERSDAEEETSS